MFSRTAAELGRVDIVINNAGTAGGSGSATIVDMEDSLWHRTIDVNLNGSYHVSKAAARAMIGAGHGGIIINISSVAGRVGLADSGAYCASKFAVIGLTQQMALELAKYEIRVNCVCPGSVDTDMLEGTFRRTAERVGMGYEKVVSAVDRKIPLGRQGVPEEQAAAIAFLAGPDAAYITGQTLNVNGGLRMD
jgi:3-oxoacyl-[acyl-carrier protein] reductase/meso-butanediol dehydrogenase/(S,S)-butanediol dehydrogenase/diacetyl reductase